MSIQAKLYVGDHEFNVLECHFSFKKEQDSVGRPSGHTLFKGVHLLLEGTKSNLFWEWAIHPTEKKQAELHFTPRLLGTKTRRLQLIDAYCIEQRVNFLNHSVTPITETVVLTCGGFKDANFEAEYSAYWRETFPIDKSAEVITHYTINEPEPVQDIDFVKGWWSNDKAGKEPLKNAKLGDTVFFHVEVKGLSDGQKITLKLAEYDYYLLLDYLDPDDRKFPENEVVKEAIVNHGKAVVDLVLQNSWEVMIKDDSDELGNLDSTLELYWDVSYKNHKNTLPKKKDDYLRVDFNDRTLYLQPATSDYYYPELFTYSGEVLVIKKFYKDKYEGEAQKKFIGGLDSFFKKQLDKLLLTKSEKGDYLIKMDGMLFKNESIYNTNAFESSISLNDKTKIKSLKLISKKGLKLTPLKVLSNISNIFDAKELLDFATGDIDDSNPAPLQFGPLTVVSEVAGLYILSKKQEVDEILTYERQQKLLYAKSKGIEYVKNFVLHYGDETNYNHINVSKTACKKLLNGDFKNFNQLSFFDTENEISYKPIFILYKNIKNENRKIFNQVIEAIFIDN